MKISIDVIQDLWPAYTAGTASEATRQLIDECLANEPDLRSRLTSARRHLPATDWSPESEARLLDEIRWKLRSRTYLIAASVALGTLVVAAMLVGGFLLVGR